MIDQLTAEYQGWVEAHGLPAISADELIYNDGLDAAQNRYLHEYIARWETAS